MTEPELEKAHELSIKLIDTLYAQDLLIKSLKESLEEYREWLDEQVERFSVKVKELTDPNTPTRRSDGR